VPGDNRIWLDDDQDIAPRRPKPTEQNPKCSIPHSEARARVFSLEDAQLLAERKDLEAEIVAGPEEGGEAAEKADEK
jgi:hypothetical protein